MLYDRAQIKGTARITKDGYFVADALVARADNIQEYLAHEIGLTDRDPRSVVKVFRPAEEVFHRDAMASLAHRPITLDHPSGAVSADNWRELAVGDVGDEVVRDGEFVRVPIKIMDAAAIKSVASDRREFSLGYSLELDMTPGEHAGQAYDAVARQFRYNHLAAVKAARGGTELRIIDERTYSDSEPGDKNARNQRRDDCRENFEMPHTLIIDGLQVPNVSDEAKAAIEKLQGQVADANARAEKAEGQVATLTTDKATLEGEKAALEQKVKDAQLSPAQLEKLVADRAALITQAKAIDPKVVTDGKSEAEIRAAVVQAKLGDDAVELDDEAAVAGAFAVLAKDVKPADPLRDTIKDGVKPNSDGLTAVSDARAAWLNSKESAYRGTEMEA